MTTRKGRTCAYRQVGSGSLPHFYFIGLSMDNDEIVQKKLDHIWVMISLIITQMEKQREEIKILSLQIKQLETDIQTKPLN